MQAKDREVVEQARIRDRIGSYHKNNDQVRISEPLQESPDYLPPDQRYEKDFAAYERQQRAQKMAKKQDHLERRRLENFDRDMKRWEFMEAQEVDKNR